MIKAVFPAFRIYQNTIKESVKSWWFLLWLVIPCALAIAYFLIENHLLLLLKPAALAEPDKSLEFYRDLFRIMISEVLWAAGLLCLSWTLLYHFPFQRLLGYVNRISIDRSSMLPTLIILLSFGISVIVSFRTLESFPNSSDEYAYLYQAETFANGNLWETAHEESDFFHFNHIVQKDHISVSRFPPGWPAILSLAFKISIEPGWVNPLLGLLTLIAFYRFAVRYYDRTIALWALAALALSAFFVFNSASYFSHVCCALFSLGFAYGCRAYVGFRNPLWLVFAGFCIGLVAVTRYYTAALMCVPFGIFLIYRLRWESIKAFFILAIGTLPPVGALMWYNYSITGSALLPVTMWAYDDEALGFVKGHNVMKGIEHLVRWAGMFVYWASPAILILYILSLFKRSKSAEPLLSRPERYVFVVLIIGYFFYYEIGGNQYGPRFFFEAFPFVVLSVVQFCLRSQVKWKVALLAASLIIAFVRIPFIASREHQVVEERLDLYRTVEAENISNAVVLVSDYTGVIRPMPAGDLTRNDFYYLNDVLYALDLGTRNLELINYYPDRNFYRYNREKGKVHGALKRVRIR